MHDRSPQRCDSRRAADLCERTDDDVVHSLTQTWGDTYVWVGTRSSRLRILPVTVFGSSSTNSIERGYLYADIRSLQNAMSSSADADSPGRRLTKAFTVSPRYSSGTPTTAASRTAGCWYRT